MFKFMYILLLAHAYTMLYTASQKFWSVRCAASKSSTDTRIYCKIVNGAWADMANKWLQITPDEKFYRQEVRKSWWSFDLSPAPSPSPVNNFIRPVSHLANEMKWSSILPKLNQTSYCEWHCFHIRFHHIIQQLEILFGVHSSSSSFFSSHEQ